MQEGKRVTSAEGNGERIAALAVRATHGPLGDSLRGGLFRLRFRSSVGRKSATGFEVGGLPARGTPQCGITRKPYIASTN